MKYSYRLYFLFNCILIKYTFDKLYLKNDHLMLSFDLRKLETSGSRHLVTFFKYNMFGQKKSEF